MRSTFVICMPKINLLNNTGDHFIYGSHVFFFIHRKDSPVHI